MDVAIGEAEGNGGDIKFQGNDIAVVFGNENQIYLALFGGNVEQSTPARPTVEPTFDYWGNDLFYPGDPSRQFNSQTERVLNATALNSAGRIKIENAVKNDLQYLKDLGAEVTVSVTIPSVNVVRIEIRTKYPDGPGILTVITFGKRFTDGDFSILDFNSDFY